MNNLAEKMAWPEFWVDHEGSHPPPSSRIRAGEVVFTAEEIRNGRWMPAIPCDKSELRRLIQGRDYVQLFPYLWPGTLEAYLAAGMGHRGFG